MAILINTSKAVNAMNGKSWYTFYLTVVENSTNIVNNTSNITVTYYGKYNYSGNGFKDYTSSPSTEVIRVNGEQKATHGVPGISNSGQQGGNCTWTGDVPHNSDGTGKITVECSFTANHTTYYFPVNNTISASANLSTIPRATTCPNLIGDIESSYSININPASNIFTHSLKITFGNLVQYLNASGNLQSSEIKLSGSSFKFNIPASFYQQFSGKSENGTLTLVTYNGNTKIGEKNGTLKINCSESRCKPSISGTVVDINSKTLELSGDKNKLIKYFSNVSISLSLKAAVTNGDTKSTISTRTCDGTSFNGTSITKNNVSKKTFTIVVTNSRGYSTSVNVSANELIEYFSPSMNVNFYRPEQTGSNVKLTYSGSFFNQNFGNTNNSITLKWYWKKDGDNLWTTGGTISPTINGNTISEKTIDCGSVYDYQTNYRFKLEAIDKLSDGNREMPVTAGIPIYSHGKNFFQHHTPVYLLSGNEILDYEVVDTW